MITDINRNDDTLRVRHPSPGGIPTRVRTARVSHLSNGDAASSCQQRGTSIHIPAVPSTLESMSSMFNEDAAVNPPRAHMPSPLRAVPEVDTLQLGEEAAGHMLEPPLDRSAIPDAERHSALPQGARRHDSMYNFWNRLSLSNPLRQRSEC